MSKPLQIIIKRKVDGPSAPELAPPTAVTFDSITVPLVRPSTGPAAIASYSIERATSGAGPWTVAATGALIFGNPPTAYIDGGRLALTTYYYRARATDTGGRVSAYSATVSGTTTSLSPSAPITVSLAASGSTVNVGLTALAPAGNRAITQYQVERSTDGASWTSVATPDPVTASEIPAFPTANATRVVTKNGAYTATGGVPAGLPTHTSIQAAINAASNNADEVIAVKTDTYTERVLVNKSKLTIRAFTADAASRPVVDGKVNGVYTYPQGWQESGYADGSAVLFCVSGNDVWIDSIIVRNSKGFGLFLGPANNNANYVADIDDYRYRINIHRCDTQRTRGPALVAMNADDYFISGCRFTEAGWIYANNDAAPAIAEPTGWPSAVLLMGRRARFIENTIFHAYAEGLGIGYHGKISANTNPINGDCSIAGCIVRRNVIGNTWAVGMYVTEVRPFPNGDWSLIEQNLVFHADPSFYKSITASVGNRQAPPALDIGSEGNSSGTYQGTPSRDGLVGGRHFKLRNNVIIGGSSGVSFSNWPSTDFNDFYVENNTVFSQRNPFAIVGNFGNTNANTRDIRFRNNLFHSLDGNPVVKTYFDSGSYRLFQPFTGTLTVQATNLWSHEPLRESAPGVAGGSIKASSDIVNSSVGLPDTAYLPAGLWPSPPSVDLSKIKIATTSPAANAGTLNADNAVDYFGSARPTYTGKCDIGAHSLTKPLSISYSDTGRSAGTYYYRARFIESGGAVSDWSNTVAVTV